MFTLLKVFLVLLGVEAIVATQGLMPLVQTPNCYTHCPQNQLNRPQFGGCQEYAIKSEFGRLFYDCKSFTEKSGKCPTNTTQFELSPNGYLEVQCLGDWYCPPDFKCCKEDSVKGVHICKKAEMVEETKKEAGSLEVPPASKSKKPSKGSKPPSKPASGLPAAASVPAPAPVPQSPSVPASGSNNLPFTN